MYPIRCTLWRCSADCYPGKVVTGHHMNLDPTRDPTIPARRNIGKSKSCDCRLELMNVSVKKAFRMVRAHGLPDYRPNILEPLIPWCLRIGRSSQDKIPPGPPAGQHLDAPPSGHAKPFVRHRSPPNPSVDSRRPNIAQASSLRLSAAGSISTSPGPMRSSARLARSCSPDGNSSISCQKVKFRSRFLMSRGGDFLCHRRSRGNYR